MRLGNLRSDGIRDLRFGYVIEEQWRDRPLDEARPSLKVPLDPHVEQLFLAGSLSDERSAAPLGTGWCGWTAPWPSASIRAPPTSPAGCSTAWAIWPCSRTRAPMPA